MTATRQPMRPGTIVASYGVKAFVVADVGLGSIDVMCHDTRQSWVWDLSNPDCKIIAEPHGKLFYDSFDAYAEDFPEGERFRRWLTHDGTMPVSFFRLTDFAHVAAANTHLPGWYLSMTLSEYDTDKLQIYITDNDDAYVCRHFPRDERKQALDLMNNIKAAAPLTMSDLISVFGFWF